MKLDGIKVGDKIFCQQRFSSSEEIYPVLRLTKTTAVCANGTFRLSDGRMIGTTSEWNTRYGRIPTEADLLNARVRRAQNSLDRLKVTADNVAAVEALLGGHL